MPTQIPKYTPTYSVADPNHFEMDPDPIFYCDMDLNLTFHFDADPDPYCFKKVMYLKWYHQVL
jgi:hypothetical protein